MNRPKIIDKKQVMQWQIELGLLNPVCCTLCSLSGFVARIAFEINATAMTLRMFLHW
jgi:hypothetical protein